MHVGRGATAGARLTGSATIASSLPGLVRHSVVAIAGLALLLVAPRATWAQSPAEVEQARKTFAEGEAAEAAGDCATAVARYEAVVAIKETAAVRLRIGRCHERLGRLTLALADYRRAQDLAQGDARALEVATQVESALAPRIPRLEIRVPEGAAGVALTLDGAPASAGTPILVDPGRHVVTAQAPGKTPFEREITASEGQLSTVDVTLADAVVDAPPPPPPPPPAEAEGHFPWLPVGLYAVGGVALGVAVPLLATSASDDADLDARCFDEAGRPSEDRDPCLRADGTTFSEAERAAFEDDRSSVNTRQGFGWALAGVGVAAAGVATVLLVTEEDEPTVEVGSMALHLDSIDAMATPDEAGVWVGGRF